MPSSAPSPPDVGVIVVAAGRGARLKGGGGAGGGAAPKPFREVAGVPILVHAIGPFLTHPDVAAVVVVLAPEVAAAPPRWLTALAPERLRVAAGGQERADSVRAGLAALPPPPACRIVLVHDGARPFPSSRTIAAVIEAARGGAAAVAAAPVSDTLKEASPDAGGRLVVRRTVPREGVWRAQTPQGFPRALLERAHAGPGAGATDDAGLVEALGEPVVLVPDTPLNLKVTEPDDLVLAEAIARSRR